MTAQSNSSGSSSVLPILLAPVIALGMVAVPFCCTTLIGLVPNALLPEAIKALLIPMFCAVWFGLAIPGGMVAWIAYNARKGAARLDALFTPFGLTGKSYALFGRQYAGNRQGRQVNAFYTVTGRRYLRTPDFRLYVGGSFRTRLALAEKNVLTQLGSAVLQQQPLVHTDPAYGELLIHALDERWSRALLDDPAARETITQLVGKDTPGQRGLIFGPESVMLHLRHFDPGLLAPERIGQWLSELAALAEIAERLPPPTQTAQATDLERPGKTDISRFFLPVTIGYVVLVLLCPILFFVVPTVLTILINQIPR